MSFWRQCRSYYEKIHGDWKYSLFSWPLNVINSLLHRFMETVGLQNRRLIKHHQKWIVIKYREKCLYACKFNDTWWIHRTYSQHAYAYYLKVVQFCAYVHRYVQGLKNYVFRSVISSSGREHNMKFASHSRLKGKIFTVYATTGIRWS